MKTKILSLLLLLAAMQATAQLSKWAAGVSAAGAYCNRTGVTERNQEASSWAPGFTTGVILKYRLTNIISLQSGLSYETYSIKGFDHRSSHFYDYRGTLIATYTYRIVQVPVIASCYFGKSLRFGFSAGLSAGKIMGMEYVSHKGGKRTPEMSGTTLAFMAGVGIEKDLNRFTFRAEPFFSRQQKPFETYSFNDDFNPWTAGLSISCVYQLKK